MLLAAQRDLVDREPGAGFYHNRFFFCVKTVPSRQTNNIYMQHC